MYSELIGYMWDVMNIADTNGMPYSVGLDMFFANVENRINKYEGSNLDYNELGSRWDELTKAEKTELRIKLGRCLHETYDRWTKARVAGDRAEFENILYSAGV